MRTLPRFNIPRPSATLAVAALAVAGLAGCAAPHHNHGQNTYPAPEVRGGTPSQPIGDYRRRDQEPLYEVPVSWVRAVVGPDGGQRCWIEREPVAQPRGPNVGGAILGGVVGGILGHQIGGGTGRDIATVGGAVAGAAVGSSVGRNNAPPTQDVQRCSSASNGQASYWDVGYNFRGVEHRVQMSQQPGRTLLVNGNGEPRY
jgi:outer membrane lipoprotein SlyB